MVVHLLRDHQWGMARGDCCVCAQHGYTAVVFTSHAASCGRAGYADQLAVCFHTCMYGAGSLI